MIRFTLRQFRTQAAVGLLGLVVLAVVLGITGPHLVHLYDTTVVNCAAHGDCSSAVSSFSHLDNLLQKGLNIVVIVIPAIIGLFWGPPLIARELESGTFRLAFTQGVTRLRWLVVKLAVVGLASMAVAGLCSLVVTWWEGPFDTIGADRFSLFDARGVVAIGYAAFAFALGTTAGALIRRTLPAMAVTLVGFVATRLLFINYVRPHLFSPVTLNIPLSASQMGFGSINGGPITLQPATPNIANAWFYSTQIVDKAGNVPTAGLLARLCPTLGAGIPPPSSAGGVTHVALHGGGPGGPGVPQALQSCVAKLAPSYHELVAYQPISRYWSFQWCELGIYLGLALLLAAFCGWWIRRRLA